MEVIGFFAGGLTAEDLLVGAAVIVVLCLSMRLGREPDRWPGFTVVLENRDMPINERIDRRSGELIFDKVPLEQAKYISDKQVSGDQEPIPAQVYMLADCTTEQFNEYNQTQYPVKLGYFYKDAWTAGLPFYLFRCFKCSEYMVGYKSGHEPYLFCKSCDHTNPFYIFGMKRSV